MKNIRERLHTLGMDLPEILLPKDDVDMQKWAVIACDQFSSEKEYWEQVEDFAKEGPSTVNLIFAECFLEDGDKEARIKNIHDTMNNYLAEDVFTSLKPGFMYIERITEFGTTRKGLVTAVDLERYDYSKGSTSLIRATEGTILDRIPPRVKVRKGAPVELPHIMLLIDDPLKHIIEPLSDKLAAETPTYNFELMMNSGHIKGWHINDAELLNKITERFEDLNDVDAFEKKYGTRDMLLFAAGDGNHSLATAKATWDDLKKTLPADEIETHPSRYALVEIVNIYDEGLNFEPIHRVMFNVDVIDIFAGLRKAYPSMTITEMSFKEMVDTIHAPKGQSHLIGFCDEDKTGVISIKDSNANLEVGTLQNYLDDFLGKHPESSIDYIHGEESLKKLGKQEGNIGFYLPPMEKSQLFETVIKDGALPRKTFSMGEASEKRFYIEGRRILKK